MATCFLFTVAMCALTGLILLVLQRQAEARIVARLLADKERALKRERERSVTYGIAQFRLGVDAGRRLERRDAAEFREVAFVTGEGRN